MPDTNGRLRVDIKYVVAIIGAMAALIGLLVTNLVAAGGESRQQILNNQGRILANQALLSESQARIAGILDSLDKRQSLQFERLYLEMGLLREQIRLRAGK
jgi:hypothetical protein